MTPLAASHSRDLTDEQWVLIGPFLPKLKRRKDGRGRPWRENRAVLNGILWILRTGAPWADLPGRYPSYQTCHRRFQHWVRCGVLNDILSVLAEALHDEGYLDLREAFIDGSFAPAKKGGAGVGTTKRGEGSKIMAIADRHGRPVAIHIESATPHEVTLVEATLAHRLVKKTPERLIGDNAYESDQLDAELAQRGIELIAPHRRNFAEDLIECLLALVVPPNRQRAGPSASDRVDLVDEDDRRSDFAGFAEQFANAACSDADNHLDER